MTSLSLLRAMNIGFFSALVGLLFGASRPIGFWLLLLLVLNFEDLCTNLLVHRAASISLEEKDSFSKNTLYSSDTMKTNVNKHFFLHWVTTFQGFLVESHYVDVQVFI